MKTIGNQIFEARKKRNLTLAQLSELTDISASALTRYETDKTMPTMDRLSAISSALDIIFTITFLPCRRVPEFLWITCQSQCFENTIQK